jgi:hypothetical protein
MKESVYKSYDELPLFLNASTVAKALGVSPSTGYELLHEKDFRVAEDRQPHRRTMRVHALDASRTQRISMKYNRYPNETPIKNYFPLPTKFLCWAWRPGELASTRTSLREDRKTTSVIPATKLRAEQSENPRTA